MKLYEYSEKNNREMGVLLQNGLIDDNNGDTVWGDEESFFEDTKLEIKDILNSSSIDRLSNRYHKKYKINLLKTKEDLEAEFCDNINTFFLNKQFKPFIDENGNWFSICNNYYDKVDVVFEGHRMVKSFFVCKNMKGYAAHS
jgi:hypothetical protein